jgi:hypothetical protein
MKAKMSLTVTLPSDWKAASNSIETRYQKATGEGRRVLQKHGIEWFLDFYSTDEVSVCVFE